MSNNPLLSIVIPVYNEEDRIGGLLEILLKQDNHQLEIVVIDDGSTDKTSEILESFLGRFNNYKFYKKENGGPGSARNHGLTNLSGTYIYFLDSDDSFSKDLIQILFIHLNSQNDKQLDLLVFGYSKRIIKNEVEMGRYTSQLVDYREYENSAILNDFYRLMAMEARLSVWNKIFRREIIRSNNIQFPIKKRTEDMFFFLDYMKCVQSVVIIPDILYNHSSHFNENKFDNNLISNHLELFEKLKDLLRANCNRMNTMYLLKMFVSWFAFVIPLNIYRNRKLSSIERKQLMNGLFSHTTFTDNLKSLNKLQNIPLRSKFILLLLKLKSPTLILNLVKFSEKVSREKIKSLMKN